MRNYACGFRRRCLLALLAAVVAMAATGGCFGGSNGKNTRYVALGNSIAFGTGATSRDGYVSLFRDALERRIGKVNLENLAVPLIKSGDLLAALKNDLPVGIRRAVRDADIITVSIGGNNLLDCANDDYTALDTGCMANGAADFAADWPQILAEIRTRIGSRARLYVMTIYNPYPGDDPNYPAAETYLQQINAVIQDPTNQATYNYKVADVYTDFQGQFPDGDWKVCRWTHFCETPRDVHPTDAGHAEIARLHDAIYP